MKGIVERAQPLQDVVWRPAVEDRDARQACPYGCLNLLVAGRCCVRAVHRCGQVPPGQHLILGPGRVRPVMKGIVE
eukprot:4618940-Alexandrium_andersonii.AAC.1